MCERCGTQPATERHHKDGNPLNNDSKNIQGVCNRCHQIIDGRLEKLKLRMKKFNADRWTDPENHAAQSAKVKAWWASRKTPANPLC
jgi:hypothetical protein